MSTAVVVHVCDCFYAVDATDAHSATGTGEEVDRSGLTTYTATVLKHSLATVLIVAGVPITVHMLKTYPLCAMTIQFQEVWILPSC